VANTVDWVLSIFETWWAIRCTTVIMTDLGTLSVSRTWIMGVLVGNRRADMARPDDGL